MTPIRVRTLCSSLALALSILVWSTVSAAPNEALRERIDAIRYAPGSLIGSERIFSTRILPELYERNGFALLWSAAENEQALIDAVRTAYEDGLEPHDYHLEALVRPAPADDAARAERDILLTDALLGLLYHLRVGKVDPVGLDPQWNFGSELRVDDAMLAQLKESIASGNVRRAIDAARPSYPLYAELRGALRTHREFERAGAGHPSRPARP